MGASIPIWADGTSAPALVRLILGKTELLSAMCIIKKLDLTVNFGIAQFKVGQSEWRTMTFNGKHRLVFPLVPTACAYAKSNEYFGKLRGLAIEGLQLQGDFVKNLPVLKFLRNRQHRL